MDPQSAILIVIAFLSSALSGVIGMGGGILLLAAMASYFPPGILIPLHGTVQLASNVVRAALGWRELSWRIFLSMAAGSLAGAAIGTGLVISLPESGYQIAIGTSILLMTWLPGIHVVSRIPGKFIWLGTLSTALSFAVGATGPLMAPFFLHEGLHKESLITTKAAGQAVTHALKLAVFSAMGFQLAEHWPLLLGLLVAATLGTACGKILLGYIPERLFVALFKVAITCLAARMVYNGIGD